MVISREAAFLNEAYKCNLSYFIQRSFDYAGVGDYHHNWHIDAIAEYLTACMRREIKRLIINMPPRSMKTISVSSAFPAWMLGHNPKLEIMTASYQQGVSDDASRKFTKIVSSSWYKALFPNVEWVKNLESLMITSAGGKREATSLKGASTGKGGNFLILDDPLNPKQAASDKDREAAIDFVSSTWPSRLNNRKEDVSILVMQRLHQEDPTGYLLEGGGWEHLCLPAINDKKRTISIGNFHKEWAAGDLLDEVRLSKEILHEIREVDRMSSFQFAGQYLQLPVPDGGGIIKEESWQPWTGKKPPKTVDIIQVYDTAFTEKTTNDFCARTTWGVFEADDSEKNIILLERLNERMEFPALRVEAKRSYRDYTDKDGNEPLVLIEEKASGLPLIQEMKLTGMRVRGIKRNSNAGDKISRAHNITHVFEGGRVWVPCNMIEVDGKLTYRPKPWAQEVIDQCAIFPNGTHDDLVDTVIDAVAYLRMRSSINIEGDRDDTPYEPRQTGKKKRFY